MPPYTAAFLTRLSADFLLAFLILALLISYAAAGLASRLARGLAFAASAVLCALAKVLCIKCLNTLHKIYPPINIDLYNTLYHRLSHKSSVFFKKCFFFFILQLFIDTKRF